MVNGSSAKGGNLDDKLQRLIDKDEIRDLISRYARGVDRADWDLVRDTYHPDATDDHGDYKGEWEGLSSLPGIALRAQHR